MRPAAVIRFTTYIFAGLLLIGCIAGTMGLARSFLGNPSNFADKILWRLPADRVVSLVPYVPVEGTLTPGTGTPSQILTTWSHFRGDNRDAISTETIPLRRNWTDANPPPTLWEISTESEKPLGEGFAGFAVRNGCVYMLDYDEANQRDALRCLSLDDGEEIWRYSYPVAIKRNHGMSRTIPAVTDQYCVSIGPKCHVLCVDALTGEEKWLIDLRHEYGTIEPDWYAGQCPIIVTLQKNGKEAAIIAPAGPEALMVALDCETGEEVWRTPNPLGWNMTHASLVPMTLDGELTFVYLGDDGLAGVRAYDGEILWSWTGWATALATCSSPVILSENRIFFTGGYNRGAGMLQVVASPSGKYEVRELFRLDHSVFDSEQQTPIYYEGHIFGLRQRDKRFVCLDVNGRIVWESGRTERFGSGAYIIADGMILIVDDEGMLSGLRATPSGFHRYFEVSIMEDYACWAPMAIIQGRLLLRDQHNMKCIDLR